MKRLTGILIATAGAGLASAGVIALLNFKDLNRQLSSNLKNLRDDLELDCDLINSTLADIPEVADSEAKRKLRDTINAAANFVTSTLNVYAFLTDERISALSPQAKNAYIECLRSIIRNAEAHIIAIDVARDELDKAQKSSNT